MHPPADLIEERPPSAPTGIWPSAAAPLRVPPSIPLAMALICAGYYIGSQIGFLLRIPPATPSVLWPPNAILTAALLLTRPRDWPLCLLAALPAHVFAQTVSAPWPLHVTLALFLTNCSEALIGAAVVRALSDSPARLDTLRRATAFLLGAAVAGPYFSSFLDAAVVTGLRGEPYWITWITRFPSNVLTELALVPAILTVVRQRARWIRAATVRRRAEAVALLLSVLAVAITVFTVPRAFVPPLALLLPLLGWAAIRFGPGGASLSLLASALVAVWAQTHGLGLFGALPEGEGVRALQLFLILIAAPLVCLGALLEERHRVSVALRERLRVEELLSRLSRAFVQPSPGETHDAFRSSLRRLGRYLRVDGVLLLVPGADDGGFRVAHAWAHPATSSLPAAVTARDYPWLTAELGAGRRVTVPRRDALPPEARRDLASLEASGIGSALVLPLLTGPRVLGGLVFLARRERRWPAKLLDEMRMVGGVLANAVARDQSEAALRASETMKGAILSSLTSQVAVLDRHGIVIALNDRWMRATADADGDGVLGGDYVDLCRRSGQPMSADDVVGVQSVLEGSRASYAAEHATLIGTDERWHAVSVVPLNRAEGGAVVSHTDITERRLAEVEAHRSREELAHFLRVSTMGELTTSIAHELNQPLTAILANAQTARHILGTENPDLGELREIVSDMIEEDKRAGEVIRRLRELLKKGSRETLPLDLNTLVSGTAHIVSSNALIRNVTVRVHLCPQPLMASGDRVQIQQILLNLTLNALEAMADAGPVRTLVLRSSRTANGHAQVDVEDTGSGLREGLREVVFQPFYSTKADGMGMGLAIARSIAEAHNGRLWADGNAAGGSTFHLTLPLAAG